LLFESKSADKSLVKSTIDKHPKTNSLHIMSQRRGAKESGGAVQKSEEILPFSKVLDNSNPSSSSSPSTIGGLDPLQVVSPPNSSGRSAETSQTEVEGAVSLDERYHAETQQHKTKQWQESHFARTGRIFLMKFLHTYLF